MNKQHYTYRITNTKLNKHYYGTRRSLVPREDLGIKNLFISDEQKMYFDKKYGYMKFSNLGLDSISLKARLNN